MDKCVSKCDLGNYSIGKQRKYRRVMATNIRKVRMTMKTQKKNSRTLKPVDTSVSVLEERTRIYDMYQNFIF